MGQYEERDFGPLGSKCNVSTIPSYQGSRTHVEEEEERLQEQEVIGDYRKTGSSRHSQTDEYRNS